jgi:replicative DNA helicase
MAVEIKKEFGMRNRTDFSTMIYGKVPPQAIDMERAVLGACLMESNAVEKVCDILQSHEMFYSDPHQKIYEAMMMLKADGNPVDVLTVTEQLRNNDTLELVGGSYYIMQLTSEIVSTAHIEYHAQIIYEKYVGRELIRISGSLINDAYNDSTDAFELLDLAKKHLENVSIGMPSGSSQPVYKYVKEISEDITKMKEQKITFTGIDTGYREINQITKGWQLGTLIVLAARPSRGKTALALNLAENATSSRVTTNSDSLVFSLETRAKSLVQRLVSRKLHIKYEKILDSTISEGEHHAMTSQLHEFYKLKINISDNIFTLKGIISSIKIEKKNNPNLKLVVIDFIQLVNNQQKGANREQEVSGISRALKLCAMEENIAIIALSQLNRSIETRSTDKTPKLSDLRESGAIEQDANIVMFIHTETNSEGVVESFIIVEKNKDGRCGKIKLRFSGEYMSWLDPDDFTQNTDYKTDYIPPFAPPPPAKSDEEF